MTFLLYLSDYMIPFVIFYVVGYGILTKTAIFDEFVKGAKDGFKVVIDILPTLIGLMRASGAFDMLANLLKPLMALLRFPAELVPLVIVKMFSSSAATSLVLDIFKQYGPDSYLGTLTSLLMSCTETIFYTMAVYFMAAKVKKTRYTLAGALVATLSGVIISTILANLM